MKKSIIRFCIVLSLILSVSCTTNQIPRTSETPETHETDHTNDMITSNPQTVTKDEEKTTDKTVENEMYTNNIPISSVFYSKRTMDIIKYNTENMLEFKAAKRTAEKLTEKYMVYSYDELWNMVFGPELDRSWMVKSDGICPSCKAPVIMYDWIIRPHENPWKLECPKCHELFPKNDFEAYYKSGLDHRGRFSYELANDDLLYNVETGDKTDKFGVDDGMGYAQNGEVFRFIQTYLVYGQWKYTILDAIKCLSDAYVYTGNTEYAVRTLILLDRLADFWPEYDFAEQGWLYDDRAYCTGYISYIVNSAFECFDLALAYDKVIEVLYMEPKIIEFLSEKANITGIDNKKLTPYDIKKNIDERILKDFIEHSEKLDCNPPYTDLALFTARAVLNWPENQNELENDISDIIIQNTRYDGLTGESGLYGYATMGKSAIAKLCNLFILADPDFIDKMYERCPKLYDAYRFHIDLHCVNRYYPILGDVGYFGDVVGNYPASGKEENMVLYKLYELTGDEDLLKTLFRVNGGTYTAAFQPYVGVEEINEKYTIFKQVVDKDKNIILNSVRKDEYQIAVLRTGVASDKTEVWINFGTNKISHSHGDGMNIGIYYKDVDLMPDNGYPNVSYGGGWYSSEVYWMTGTISHNVISFNKQSHRRADGFITLWSIGDIFKVIRANAPGTFNNVDKYERSLALIDINDKNAYVLDIFRVGNGPAGSYEKYSRSNISVLNTSGLNLSAVNREYPANVYMSNFQKSINTEEVWMADWFIENYFSAFTSGFKMHLNMIDMTRNENVYTCDTWLPPSMTLKSKGHEGFQLATVITERIVEEGETAAFVSIMEPYSIESKIISTKRLNCINGNDGVEYDSNIAVEVKTFNGNTDVIILLDNDIDVGESGVVVDTDRGLIKTDAQSCLIRYDDSNNIVLIRASKGNFVSINGIQYNVNDSEQISSHDCK